METVDFAVIGGGIAGASAAYELAAHGSVALVEAEPMCGYHTTGRSAAVFTEAYEHDVVRPLATGSRGFLHRPPEGFTDVPLLTSLPIMLIGRADQCSRLDAEVSSARRFVPSVQRLSGPEAVERCAVLRTDYVDCALYEPDAGALDVDALHQGFLRGLRNRGGTIHTGRPVSNLRRRNGSWVVGAEGGDDVRAGAVVDAAGAWADRVAALAGVAPLGLVPHRRTAFIFAAPGDVDLARMPMVIDVDEKFYFKPEGGHFLASPADETPMEPHDVKHEEIDVAAAIERIEAATTLQIRHVPRAWAGLRTFAPDRLPVVGEDAEASGFYWLAGQGGFGILTSPAMSRVLAGLATGAGIPDDLADLGVTEAALSPQRFR